MAFGLLWLFGVKKKNCVCLVFIDILGIIRGSFGFERFLFPLRVE